MPEVPRTAIDSMLDLNSCLIDQVGRLSENITRLEHSIENLTEATKENGRHVSEMRQSIDALAKVQNDNISSLVSALREQTAMFGKVLERQTS